MSGLSGLLDAIKKLRRKAGGDSQAVLGRERNRNQRMDEPGELSSPNPDEVSDAPEEEFIDEDLPSINKRSSGVNFFGFTQLAAVVVTGVIVYLLLQDASPKPQPQINRPVAQEPIVNTLPPLVVPPPPVPLIAPAPTVPAPAPVPVVVPPPPAEPDWVSRKVNSKPLIGDDGGAASGTAPAVPSTNNSQQPSKPASEASSKPAESGTGGATTGKQEGELSENLKPLTVTKGGLAGVLPNRNFLITKGTMLDCALETALDSTLSGMVTCRLTRDVYSDNGRVIMLDRGSQLIGEYKSGVQEGLGRIFVLWTRAKTPNGVVVDLNSPGTDALGRTGFEGFVDEHLVERYGAAFMLSIMQEGLEYARAEAGQNSVAIANPFGGMTVVNPQRQKIIDDIAKDVMRKRSRIPSVLYINQGANIQVMVVRDLDFSAVYKVEDK